MPEIRLTKDILDRVVSHCKKEYPNEACGLLGGNDGEARTLFEMTNIDPSAVSFLMDPAEQFSAMKAMRRDNEKMVAIYHSHPVSGAWPSSKDVDLAFYSDAVYIIVGLADPGQPDIKGFVIADGDVKEIPLDIIP